MSISILAAVGCGEEFLETQPTRFLTQEQAIEASEHNPDVVSGSIAGIYTQMFTPGTGGTSTSHEDFGQKAYDIYSDMLSSDMVLSKSAYGWYMRLVQYQPTQDFTFNANYRVWRYYYRIIRSANLVIASLGGNDIVPESDMNKHLLGQAKTMRAYGYFYLTQFLQRDYDPSEEILPIYDSPEVPNQGKSTAQDVFDLIIKDLTDAISLLEGFNRTAKNAADLNVAKGLLAYARAAIGDYTEVKMLTDQIIMSGTYTLTNKMQALSSGFNDVKAPGWMWGADITADNGLSLISWWGQIDIYSFSYAYFQEPKAIDQALYDEIRANDVRKKWFLNAPGNVYHLVPNGKFYTPDRELGTQRQILTDYVYMRVAEMYLLNAEACMKTGDEAGARIRLKELLKERLPANEISYVDNLSGPDLLDEIYLQTRIELWGEGKTYLAMKRLDRSTRRGENHLYNVGETLQSDDPKLTFLIPQLEIQNNILISEQNE